MSTAQPSPDTSLSEPSPVPELIYISVWSDPLIDRLGHDPRSAYVEQFWLSVLGPSTVWLLRHWAGILDQEPDGAEIDLAITARRLGLGHKGGRNSPLARSMIRACRFGAARATGSGRLEVRRRLPPLNRGQIQRLPEALQRCHQVYLDAPLASADPTTQERARRLALGLVECGDPIDAAEIQLDRWSFSPTVAAEAVNWAWDLHHRRAGIGPEAA